MSFTLVIKPEAVSEATEIHAYYRRIGQHLADRFDKELDACYKQIEQRPASHPIRKRNYRHVQLKKFPYRVVYTLTDREVVVSRRRQSAMARRRQVRHTSRKPSKQFGP